MRFTCTIEGLEANWIEFKDFWGRSQSDDLIQMPEPEGFDKYAPLKCTGCHIERISIDENDNPVPMPPLTDPKDLNHTQFQDMDDRVVGFVSAAIYRSVYEGRKLGNVSGRLSSNGVALMMMTAQQSPMLS